MDTNAADPSRSTTEQLDKVMPLAEQKLEAYNSMLALGGTVSGSNAQRLLHSARNLLEPIIDSATAEDRETATFRKGVDLLVKCYEKEATLLRQIGKATQSTRDRFLFFYQSATVSEKALQLKGDDLEALNTCALNYVAQACMIKPSAEQDSYFNKAYDMYSRAYHIAKEGDGHAFQQTCLINWANAFGEQAERQVIIEIQSPSIPPPRYTNLPQDYELWFHLKRKKEEEADQLYSHSISKYKEYLSTTSPKEPSKILLGMAVCLQERAKNKEIDATDTTAKDVDKFYSSASALYKKIIANKLRKKKLAQHDASESARADAIISSTLLGAYVNGTMVLMNQARFRAVFNHCFAPFPTVSLQLLEECKSMISQFLQMDGAGQLPELCEIIQKRMEEVEEFETILIFKDKMEAFQHALKKQP